MQNRSRQKKLSRSDATARLIDHVLKMNHDQIIELLDLVEKTNVGNKRKSLRLNHKGEATYVIKGKVYTGYIKDISTSGAFINSPDVADAGEEVLLSFDLPMGKPLRASGSVVRGEEDGFAVSFDHTISGPLSL